MKPFELAVSLRGSLLLLLGMLCTMAIHTDDKWVEIGNPSVIKDEQSQQKDADAAAVDRIVKDNLVNPEAIPVAYSIITGRPEKASHAAEEATMLQARVLKTNRTQFSQLFDAIRDTCATALKPYEPSSPAPEPEPELTEVGWGATLDHNYQKMADASNSKFQEHFNKRIAALKKACAIRIEAAKTGGDFIQFHDTTAPVASWTQYQAGASQQLWTMLQQTSKDAVGLAAQVAKLSTSLSTRKTDDVKEAKRLGMYVAVDGSTSYARNATLNRQLGTQVAEANQRLAESVNLWVQRTTNVVERLKESCMLRLSEAKKAAGAFTGIEPRLAWPDGFHTGNAIDQGPLAMMPVSPDKSSSEAKLLTQQLLDEEQTQTSMIESSWGLQDEGQNTDGLRTALTRLQEEWEQKYDELKLRLEQQCKLKIVATKADTKAKAAKAAAKAGE